MDTLKQYWKGGVWIPPDLKDNLNSSLSFGQAAPDLWFACLSPLLACLPEAVINLQACDLHARVCVFVLHVILFLLHVSLACFACDFFVVSSCCIMSVHHDVSQPLNCKRYFLDGFYAKKMFRRWKMMNRLLSFSDFTV